MRFKILIIFLLILTSISSVKAYDTFALKHYYNMDEIGTNVTSINDSIGINKLTKMIYFGELRNVTGIRNTALNAYSNVVRFGNKTYSDIDFGLQNWSINFWIKKDTLIIFYFDKTSLQCAAGEGGSCQFSFGASALGGSAATNMSLSNWEMYTITYTNATNYKLYQDANLILTSAAIGPLYHMTNFSIYFNGVLGNATIDELSIWNKVLSTSEMSELYGDPDILSPLNYTIPSSNSTINYTGNFTKIGLSYFSSKQCVNAGSVDYLCNNSFYNIYDNSFYCDIDDIIQCPTGQECMTYSFDINTSEQFVYDSVKNCDNVRADYNSLSLECTDFIKSINPLINLLSTYFGYNCSSVLGYYPFSTDFCSDLTVWDLTTTRPLDTFYVEGQCTGKSCTDMCTPNTYQCGSLAQSQVCQLQNNTGCYDWEVNANCEPGDLCNDDTGLCSPIIKDNTCNNDNDCPNGAYCNSIGECIVGNDPNDDSSSSFCNTLPKQTIYIIVLVLIVLTIVGATALGFTHGMGKGGFIIGAIIGVFEFIIATILGCIPVWVLIVMILVSVAIMILVSYAGKGDSGG